MAVAQQFVGGAAAGGKHRRADADLDAVLAACRPIAASRMRRRCGSANCSTVSVMSAQGMAIANSSPLSRAMVPLAPTCWLKRSATARNTRSPSAWPSRSLMFWKPSRPSTSSATSRPSVSARDDHRGQSGGAACCGWQGRSAYRTRPDSGCFSASRLRTEMSRSTAPYWKPSAPCQPEKLASTGKLSPLLRRPSNSITVPWASPARVADRERRLVAFGIARTDGVERTADHLRGLVAEDRGGARIPHRDQVVRIGADQAVAERHRDALKAALGDPAEQIAKIDLVECDGRDIDRDRDVKQRRVEDERKCRLQQIGQGFDRDRRCSERGEPPAGRTAGATPAPWQARAKRDRSAWWWWTSSAARGPAGSIPPPASAAPGRTRCRHWER